jgi:hypothetical protein
MFIRKVLNVVLFLGLILTGSVASAQFAPSFMGDYWGVGILSDGGVDSAMMMDDSNPDYMLMYVCINNNIDKCAFGIKAPGKCYSGIYNGMLSDDFGQYKIKLVCPEKNEPTIVAGKLLYLIGVGGVKLSRLFSSSRVNIVMYSTPSRSFSFVTSGGKEAYKHFMALLKIKNY